VLAGTATTLEIGAVAGVGVNEPEAAGLALTLNAVALAINRVALEPLASSSNKEASAIGARVTEDGHREYLLLPYLTTIQVQIKYNSIN
jgi:hypothetical protein